MNSFNELFFGLTLNQVHAINFSKKTPKLYSFTLINLLHSICVALLILLKFLTKSTMKKTQNNKF